MSNIELLPTLLLTPFLSEPRFIRIDQGNVTALIPIKIYKELQNERPKRSRKNKAIGDLFA